MNFFFLLNILIIFSDLFNERGTGKMLKKLLHKKQNQLDKII